MSESNILMWAGISVSVWVIVLLLSTLAAVKEQLEDLTEEVRRRGSR